MPTRSLETEQQRDALHRYIDAMPLPLTVTVLKGRRRTTIQNQLQRKWINEIAEQHGDRTPEKVRGELKLMIGVPVLKAENEAFAQKYDEHIRGLPYETKLAMMMEPLDFPVTRLMTTKGHAKFLDQVQRKYTEMGFVLTDPDALRYRDFAA